MRERERECVCERERERKRESSIILNTLGGGLALKEIGWKGAVSRLLAAAKLYVAGPGFQICLPRVNEFVVGSRSTTVT